MLNRTQQLAGIVAGTMAFVVTAAAQGKPATRIPAVEVVATKVPEAPHDVPASIEVISGQDLRARGASTLGDALAFAAGVSIAPGGDAGPASAVPEFWGLREFDAFLLVVDGTPWGGAFNPAISTLSLRDVERVEILRGPAPVTYGATSFVGVIHVVHTAAAEEARYLSANGGTFGSGSLAADFATPFLAKWSSRATADVDKQGFKDDRTSFARGHALWRGSLVEGDKRTWLTADLNMLRQEPSSPHPREGAALSASVPLDANYNPSGAFLDEDRIFISGGLERPVLNGATWNATASFTHSAQRIFRGFLTDISNSANNASGFRENIDINDLYADTHIVWPAMSNVRYLAGADLLFGGGEAKGATFTYTAPLSGVSAPSVNEPSVLNLDSGSDRLFFGAYGSAEWRPSHRFTLSAGTRANVTRESRGEGEAVTHSRLSGTLGALWSLWEQDVNHVRFFANLRSTFKPAAFDFSLAENEGVLAPETSDSYEGGLKVRALNGTVDFEASAFHMNMNNLVTATVVNNLPALMSSGKTRFQGVELAADLRLPLSNFVRASFSAHDGKFVDFVQAFDGVPTQLAGKRIEMSARQLWSAGLSHAPDEGFIANAGINYIGDRFMNMRNTAPLGGFSTIDAGMGYRTARAEYRLDGRNLGNRRDVVSESEFGDAQYYRMPAMTVKAGVVIRY
jgi:outer membrane receptor protein involved in Fe transport